MRLDVFSDVVCPWCYLGAARLRDALDRAGGDDVEVRWRAFQLDPSASHPPRPLRPVLERRYGPGAFDAMTERLVGLGRAAGLEYRFDEALALNTADAHRLVAWSQHDRPELTTALVWRLFAAYFTDGDDVSDRAVLAGLAAEVGLDAVAAAEMLTAGGFADQVAADRRAAAELDISGVPTFVVDGRFALPGAQDVDRLVAVIERGRARHRRPDERACHEELIAVVGRLAVPVRRRRSHRRTAEHPVAKSTSKSKSKRHDSSRDGRRPDDAGSKEARRALRRMRQEEELKPFQVELLKLQRHLEDQNKRMVVVFEGRGAAGKGGTIRRVTRYMNEKHYRVVALGRPTEEQRSQWYFQRYVAQFPSGGEIVLFDRSWYNRSMVEPVFGFCTEEEYENFMHGVVGFEKDLVRQGTILVKLYFSVTKKEQARRFERRRDDPLRQWKLSEIDVQAQEHWNDFTERKSAMLKRTSTVEAPWTVIRSGDKHLARMNAMRVILNAVDYGPRDSDIDFVPDSRVVLSGAQELQLMEAQWIRKGRFTV